MRTYLPIGSPLWRCVAAPLLAVPLGERCRLPPPISVLRWPFAEGRSTSCPQKLHPSGAFGRCPRKHALDDRSSELIARCFDGNQRRGGDVEAVNEELGARHTDPSSAVRSARRVEHSDLIGHREKQRVQDRRTLAQRVDKVARSRAGIPVAWRSNPISRPCCQILAVEQHRVNEMIEGASGRPGLQSGIVPPVLRHSESDSSDPFRCRAYINWSEFHINSLPEARVTTPGDPVAPELPICAAAGSSATLRSRPNGRVANRCRRCWRLNSSDGILLCSRFAPPRHLRQKVTITPQTIVATLKVNGELGRLPPAEDPVASTVKAFVRRDGETCSKVIAKRGLWNHDHQAHLDRDIVVDVEADRYIQHWKDPRTGKSRFLKDERPSGRRTRRQA